MGRSTRQHPSALPPPELVLGFSSENSPWKSSPLLVSRLPSPPALRPPSKGPPCKAPSPSQPARAHTLGKRGCPRRPRLRPLSSI